MTCRPAAVAAAASSLSAAYASMYGFDGTTVAEAARRAFTPTGPSLAELEARIRAMRGLAEHQPAVA